MELIIDSQRAYITKWDSIGTPSSVTLGTTVNALGNILCILQSEFSDIVTASPQDYEKYVINSIFPTSSVDDRNICNPTKEIWGLKVSWAEVYSVQLFLKDEKQVVFTPEYAEKWRIQYRTKSVEPLDWLHADYDQGLRINIASLFDIFYGFIHYYAFHGMNLKKCEHCGRWFATTSFKKKYCSRTSPCTGYTHLNCEQAVRNIMQNCSRIKNRIETKARNARIGSNSFIYDFALKCDPLYLDAKRRPTVKNLLAYHAFLKSVEKNKGWLIRR